VFCASLPAFALQAPRAFAAQLTSSDVRASLYGMICACNVPIELAYRVVLYASSVLCRDQRSCVQRAVLQRAVLSQSCEASMWRTRAAAYARALCMLLSGRCTWSD
jgi:hypothetical protein